MPFIPHTDKEIADMLGTIGADSIEALFDEIPKALRIRGLDNIPSRLSEGEVTRLLSERAAQDGSPLCFIGAGAYEHHIPAAVWEIATRGEYYSAYTPYQAEASQGTLQLIYEYQTMITALTGMEVSNASLYDGASALAEAVLMAVRANRKSKSKRILMPKTVHPRYRATAETIIKHQGITLETLDYDPKSGHTSESLLPKEPGDFAALIIPQPNFFGVMEDVDELTQWAHSHKALVIAVTNPTSLAILNPPGNWGDTGADICCGEGQPLGIPLSSGGPYFGFLTAKQEFVRQMPGRIVGRTVDLDGKEGFTLTLQAREQHIRRSKATSNICTNQGLMVTAATIYMALMGPEGLKQTALRSHANTQILIQELNNVQGIDSMFNRAVFHEAVVSLPRPAKELIQALSKEAIAAGYDLSRDYPELGNAMLVCATETKTEVDIKTYVDAIRQQL